MRPSTVATYHERILRALVHIQGHLDEPLTLDELAGVACFSAYHFHRIFRGLVGESVQEHIRRLRLERAAQQLKRQDRSVIEIALDAGYESHAAFTRAFHEMFGDSPSGFRDPAPRPPACEAPPDARFIGLGPLRVAFVRHIGPYHEVGGAWASLMAWAGRRGLLGPSMRTFGICHDDPEITAPDKLRYDAALVIRDGVKAEGEIGVQEIPAGEYASAIHKGPFDRMYETYARLCAWLATRNRELRSAPGIEVYLNDPRSTPPENLLTRVHLPV